MFCLDHLDQLLFLIIHPLVHVKHIYVVNETILDVLCMLVMSYENLELSLVVSVSIYTPRDVACDAYSLYFSSYLFSSD